MAIKRKTTSKRIALTKKKTPRKSVEIGGLDCKPTPKTKTNPKGKSFEGANRTAEFKRRSAAAKKAAVTRKKNAAKKK